MCGLLVKFGKPVCSCGHHHHAHAGKTTYVLPDVLRIHSGTIWRIAQATSFMSDTRMLYHFCHNESALHLLRP